MICEAANFVIYPLLILIHHTTNVDSIFAISIPGRLSDFLHRSQIPFFKYLYNVTGNSILL